MSTYNASKTLWQRWFIKEAYPLYVTVGLGCAACAFHLTRMAFFNPDSHILKEYRMSGMPDDERDLQRGSNYYSHKIRRFVQGREIGIFPNRLFTKPEDRNDE